MKKFKKNHIITPLLIALTGLIVAVGSVLFFKQSPLPEKTPDKTEPTQSRSNQQSEPATTKTPAKTDNQENSPAITKEQTFCTRQTFENKSYIVCKVDPKEYHIGIFLNDSAGRPYNYFRNVEKMLAARGQKLAFAVNGGMYHKDFSAVGLYVEDGKQLHALSTKDGPGNFHMKPNGIFFIENNKAGVLETEAYQKAGIKPNLATQSGPMLVIENKIHPRFIPNSPFLEYRNGVGVTADGLVFFVNSEDKVNFDEFARFFRDRLKTPNALFLDGSISSLYAPEMKRYDWWYSLGPIIGIIVEKDVEQNSAK